MRQRRRFLSVASTDLCGFTLIELLVVVAIIVLLIAILLPSLGKAKSRARSVLCCTHLREIGVGFGAYSTDYSNNLPAPDISLLPRNTNLPVAVDFPWQIALWQYTTRIQLTNAQLLSDSPGTTTTNVPGTFLLNTVFVCPQGVLNARITNYRACGYAMNSDLPNVAPVNTTDAPWNRYKETQPLLNPSGTLFAADGDYYYVNANNTGNKAMDAMGSAVFDDVALAEEQNRHNYCINVVMGDGSARPMAWVNNSEIPSILNGQNVPQSATNFGQTIQLFWYGNYSPSSDFCVNPGNGL